MSDDERRNRYAAALYEFNTEGVWPPDNDRESWLEVADTAIALADEEQKELRGWLAAAKVLTAKQSRDNEALREDNQSLNDELTATEKINMWLRNEVSDYSGGLEEAREEIDRLRDQKRKDVEAFRFDRDHLVEELKLTKDLLARTERDLEAQYRSQS